VSEQRKALRIQPFVAPCRVVTEDRAVSGYLTDLSEAGARVTCEAEPPTPEATVTLELRIGRVATRSRLLARVEWARAEESGSIFGLSFAGLQGEPQAALKAVVAEFRRMASEIAS
jgi:PilZ domain